VEINLFHDDFHAITVEHIFKRFNMKKNTNKSKVMVFSKGRLPMNLNFKRNNMELEIASEFIYLGTMFQRTGSFKKNKINLAEKASKAMYVQIKQQLTQFYMYFF
jgi:hypothetical protein